MVAPASPPIASRSISRSPPCSLSAVSTVSAVRPLALTGPALTLMSRSRSAKRSPPCSLTNSDENAASPSTSSASPVERHAHRRVGVFRLAVFDLALEFRLAEDELQVAEQLALRGEIDFRLEAGGRQPADRLVDVLRQPGGETGRLADGDKQRAGEAEIVLAGPEQARRFERRAPGQRCRQRLHLPAVWRRLGLHPDVADRRVAGHHRRQVDVDRARGSTASAGRAALPASPRSGPAASALPRSLSATTASSKRTCAPVAVTEKRGSASSST